MTKITAEVYAENREKKILYIKITVPSLQMYINSCTVRPSIQNDGLWFQMPKFLIGRKWIGPIEFQKSSAFFDLLQDEAMRATDHYVHERKLEMVYPGAKLVSMDVDVMP
ncbi:MAG: hypothetical protein WAW80_03750 [Candidatus Saccharimonadales bacterium]